MSPTDPPSLPRKQRPLELTLPDELPDQAVITIHGLLHEILWAFERHYAQPINTHHGWARVYENPDDDPF